jgi:hypothetical protein
VKKKRLLLLLLAFITVFTPIASFAESGIDDQAETQPENAYAAIISSHCFCGRDYYPETENGHSAFDCTKCGQNMYSCTCNCWCGAATLTDTTGQYSAYTSKLCSGCEKPCILCDCRSDREAVLFAEQQRRTGEISSLNILRPKSALIPVLSILFSLILIVLAAAARRTDFFAKKIAAHPEPEEVKIQDTESEPDDNDYEDELSAQEPEKPPVAENRSSGAYKLYKTLAISGKARPETAVFSPADEPDVTFSQDELAVLLNVMRITPNGISPFMTPDRKDRGDTLANLILEGIVVKTDGGLKAEDNTALCLEEIALAKTVIHFDTVFSGKYTFCTCGGNWYSVNGNDVCEIRIFADINALCSWISDVFDISGTEKTIPSADISFDYDEFSLYCLSQILNFRNPFEADDLVRPEICARLRDGLEEDGYFKTADTFNALSRKTAVEDAIDSMTEKGILFESDGRFVSSRTVDAALSKGMIKDCIHLTKKGEAEFEVMFTVRENGAAAIYDDRSCVRVISAPKIPWKQYLK